MFTIDVANAIFIVCLAVGGILLLILDGALNRVPGIGRYRDARLHDLVSRGPRLARSLWKRTSSRIAEEDRTMTIGQLLDRFAE